MTGPALNPAGIPGARTIPRITSLSPTWESRPVRHPGSNIASRMEFRIKCTDSRVEARTPYESQGPPLSQARPEIRIPVSASRMEFRPQHDIHDPAVGPGCPCAGSNAGSQTPCGTEGHHAGSSGPCGLQSGILLRTGSRIPCGLQHRVWDPMSGSMCGAWYVERVREFHMGCIVS